MSYSLDTPEQVITTIDTIRIEQFNVVDIQSLPKVLVFYQPGEMIGGLFESRGDLVGPVLLGSGINTKMNTLVNGQTLYNAIKEVLYEQLAEDGVISDGVII